ncbi:MAG TPA: TonB-dependent receptor [Bacteroidota bacterium]
MKLRTALCCTLLFLVGPLAVAGTTGKIAGTVKDAQSGEALVGASVILQGTTQGAATNIDGYYVILNIPPGSYTLLSSAVGYNKRIINGVAVNIDQTTTMDIQLSSTTVEVGEVVSTAARPLVQADQTAKTAVVTGDQISALPVTEVAQVLNLQAGFVAGSLRGGRSGEVAYWIDGVPVTDAFNGSQVVEVNKDLVQELQLISGAFNAEYGQAMSGIVNIATKEGGSRFAGGLSSYIGTWAPSGGDASTIFPGNDKFRPAAIRDFEANVSGPVLSDNLTFFANGRYIYFGGWLYGFNRFNPSNIAYTDSAGTFHLFRDPSGKGDSSAVPMNNSERWYGQGKLTWHLTPTIKLTGNYIYDWQKSRRTNNDFRQYFYDPNGFGNDYNRSNTFIFQLSHTLSDRTFYTLGGSAFVKKYDYYLYPPTGTGFGDARYTHPKLLITDDPWSAYTGGSDLNVTSRSTTTYLAKLDVSSQVNEANLVKVGAELRKYKAFYDSYTLQPIPSQSDIILATGNPYITTYIPPLSSQFHSAYTHRPTQLAGYIQDKIEFKDLIVNVGLRYDYFQPDGVVLADPSDPNIYNPIKPSNRFFDYNGNGIQDPNEPAKTVDDRRAYWYRKATAKSKLSPRLGFSFPITARGIVHFSYGHFFQVPNFEDLYLNPDFKIGQGTGNQGVVGNADLQPEETVSGELGVQQQLTDDIAIDVTAYMRDIRNLTGTRAADIVIFGGASSYSQYVNSDFGFVKGIVVTLTKRFASGLSATLDYTFQIARGSASNPQDARNAIAGGAQPEVQLNPLNWDQRHTANVTVSYSTPTWGASSIIQYGSGAPFTPRRVTDITALLTNSQSKPQFFDVDLQAFYTLPVSTFKIVAFARVFNLLDIRNQVDVFNDTGVAGFTLDQTRALQTNPRQRVNTVAQYYTIPTQYSEPRRIEVGLNMEF